MTITGHKTDSVSRRYNITSDADKQEAVKKVAAYLAKRTRAGRRSPSFGLTERRRWHSDTATVRASCPATTARFRHRFGAGPPRASAKPFDLGGFVAGATTNRYG